MKEGKAMLKDYSMKEAKHIFENALNNLSALHELLQNWIDHEYITVAHAVSYLTLLKVSIDYRRI
jgi:hypothetical protein